MQLIAFARFTTQTKVNALTLKFFFLHFYESIKMTTYNNISFDFVAGNIWSTGALITENAFFLSIASFHKLLIISTTFYGYFEAEERSNKKRTRCIF